MKVLFSHLIVLLSISVISCYDKKISNDKENENEWLKEFYVNPDELATVGTNEYFILKPGYQLILKGTEDEKDVLLIITVLDETKIVDGMETRIVEERESKGGELIEVSRNYFAINKNNKDVFYFGEEVDIYKNDKIVSHEGEWESGKKSAKFGLMIPGKIIIGKKYYQEIAPGVAMDRAEIVSDSIVFETPTGRFENCLKTEETTPLEQGEKEYKIYAPGIGLVKDGSLVLTEYKNR